MPRFDVGDVVEVNVHGPDLAVREHARCGWCSTHCHV